MSRGDSDTHCRLDTLAWVFQLVCCAPVKSVEVRIITPPFAVCLLFGRVAGWRDCDCFSLPKDSMDCAACFFCHRSIPCSVPALACWASYWLHGFSNPARSYGANQRRDDISGKRSTLVCMMASLASRHDSFRSCSPFVVANAVPSDAASS